MVCICYIHRSQKILCKLLLKKAEVRSVEKKCFPPQITVPRKLSTKSELAKLITPSKSIWYQNNILDKASHFMRLQSLSIIVIMVDNLRALKFSFQGDFNLDSFPGFRKWLISFLPRILQKEYYFCWKKLESYKWMMDNKRVFMYGSPKPQKSGYLIQRTPINVLKSILVKAFVVLIEIKGMKAVAA